MVKILVLAVLVLAAAGLASATTRGVESTSVLYTRSTVPTDWTRGHHAPADAKVEFTIALKQRNLDILDKWFTEVSDPTHHNYQDFKTIDEITDLISPRPDETAKVMQWLHSNGVHKANIHSFGDALDVKTTVKHATKLFSTEFFTFQHGPTGAKVVRSFGAYSVPKSVKSLVELVTGISTFPIPHLTVKRANASNDYGVVPQTIDNLYQVSQSARKMIKKSMKNIAPNAAPSQSVIEFQGQNFAPSDLTAFGQGVAENVQAVPADQIIGPNDPTSPQTESTLDIEMVAGVNLGASNWFWLEQGNGWLYQFGVHFFSTADVPQVNSISYGWWEGDQCTIAPDECSQLGVDSTGYVLRVNTEFQKIGARGISLLSASGDSGANGRTDPDCSIPHLRPSFPGSSPYITAVGATELTNTQPLTNSPPVCSAAGYSCVASGTEQAVSYAISGFASGGGFSDIAAQPSYQSAAVGAYLSSGVALPGAGYFNQSGRAFPDVAAIGHNLLIIQGGAAQAVGGTSASSPIFASIVALLNTAQIEITGKPLGFLNPFLYQMFAKQPSAFHDVTVGDNKCTEQGCASTCQGYMCAPGWDPVTGLGTPNFEEMLAYVKAGKHMQKRQ